MWDEIVGQLADFPTAVVTGVDDTGYPFSLRCKPEPDHSTQTLRLHLPEGTRIRVGPASLLCHRHDEQLWNLKSFLVRGEVEVDARRAKLLLRPPGELDGGDVVARAIAQARSVELYFPPDRTDLGWQIAELVAAAGRE